MRNDFATALVRGDNLGFAIGGLSDTTTAANTTGELAVIQVAQRPIS